MEKNLGYLFTYFQYPESIIGSLRSSNIIERMFKEIRQRIKVIDSLHSECAAMKLIFLRMVELNEKWFNRVIKGYYRCQDEIREMFREKKHSDYLCSSKVKSLFFKKLLNFSSNIIYIINSQVIMQR
jgi:transposase-like protein